MVAVIIASCAALVPARALPQAQLTLGDEPQEPRANLIRRLPLYPDRSALKELDEALDVSTANEPKDDPNYADHPDNPKSVDCSEWRGYKCELGGYGVTTAKQKAVLLQMCPVACAWWKAHPDELPPKKAELPWVIPSFRPELDHALSGVDQDKWNLVRSFTPDSIPPPERPAYLLIKECTGGAEQLGWSFHEETGALALKAPDGEYCMDMELLSNDKPCPKPKYDVSGPTLTPTPIPTPTVSPTARFLRPSPMPSPSPSYPLEEKRKPVGANGVSFSFKVDTACGMAASAVATANARAILADHICEVVKRGMQGEGGIRIGADRIHCSLECPPPPKSASEAQLSLLNDATLPPSNAVVNVLVCAPSGAADDRFRKEIGSSFIALLRRLSTANRLNSTLDTPVHYSTASDCKRVLPRPSRESPTMWLQSPSPPAAAPSPSSPLPLPAQAPPSAAFGQQTASAQAQTQEQEQTITAPMQAQEQERPIASQLPAQSQAQATAPNSCHSSAERTTDATKCKGNQLLGIFANPEACATEVLKNSNCTLETFMWPSWNGVTFPMGHCRCCIKQSTYSPRKVWGIYRAIPLANTSRPECQSVTSGLGPIEHAVWSSQQGWHMPGDRVDSGGQVGSGKIFSDDEEGDYFALPPPAPSPPACTISAELRKRRVKCESNQLLGVFDSPETCAAETLGNGNCTIGTFMWPNWNNVSFPTGHCRCCTDHSIRMPYSPRKVWSIYHANPYGGFTCPKPATSSSVLQANSSLRQLGNDAADTQAAIWARAEEAEAAEAGAAAEEVRAKAATDRARAASEKVAEAAETAGIPIFARSAALQLLSLAPSLTYDVAHHHPTHYDKRPEARVDAKMPGLGTYAVANRCSKGPRQCFSRPRVGGIKRCGDHNASSCLGVWHVEDMSSCGEDEAADLLVPMSCDSPTAFRHHSGFELTDKGELKVNGGKTHSRSCSCVTMSKKAPVELAERVHIFKRAFPDHNAIAVMVYHQHFTDIPTIEIPLAWVGVSYTDEWDVRVMRNHSWVVPPRFRRASEHLVTGRLPPYRPEIFLLTKEYPSPPPPPVRCCDFATPRKKVVSGPDLLLPEPDELFL